MLGFAFKMNLLPKIIEFYRVPQQTQTHTDQLLIFFFLFFTKKLGTFTGRSFFFKKKKLFVSL